MMGRSGGCAQVAAAAVAAAWAGDLVSLGQLRGAGGEHPWLEQVAEATEEGPQSGHYTANRCGPGETNALEGALRGARRRCKQWQVGRQRHTGSKRAPLEGDGWARLGLGELGNRAIEGLL